MPEMLIGHTPVLVKVTGWGALVVPIAVPPKLRVVGETVPLIVEATVTGNGWETTTCPNESYITARSVWLPSEAVVVFQTI